MLKLRPEMTLTGTGRTGSKRREIALPPGSREMKRKFCFEFTMTTGEMDANSEEGMPLSGGDARPAAEADGGGGGLCGPGGAC